MLPSTAAMLREHGSKLLQYASSMPLPCVTTDVGTPAVELLRDAVSS